MAKQSVFIGMCVCMMFFAQHLCAAGKHVVLDSLVGKAEIQRAGQQRWVLASQGARLENNDMIRVLAGSLAKLIWADGSRMYVHQNSQALINIHNDTATNFLTKHTTVFFGAVFFVIKKTLPRAITSRFDTKVYTPTAVLSIRGTSFEVSVDRANGATDVSVLNGTVLAGNILKNESIFLTAGFKTSIGLNEDPAPPTTMLEKQIDSLKTWLPPAIIEEEMNTQIAQTRKDHYTITGKLEDKLLIIPFANASSYQGDWNIETRLPSFIAGKLRSSMNGATVVTSASDSLDIVAAGEDANARFVLSGTIESFDIVQRAEINAAVDRYREYYVALVGMQLSLVDIAQRKQVYAGTAYGEVSGVNDKQNSWKTIGSYALSMSDSTFSGTILAQAIEQSLEQAISGISRYLKQ
jgi:hypothetical protein